MEVTDREIQIRAGRSIRLREAFEAMVSEFGAPERNPIHHIGDDCLTVATKSNAEEMEIHPVFSLVHHFRGHDRGNLGYTSNHFRGDHQSLPMLIGEEIGVIDTSFHKGMAFVHIVTFPSADIESPLYRAAVNILHAEETR